MCEKSGRIALKLKMGGTGTDLFPPSFQVVVYGVVIASEVISDPLEGSGGRSYVKFDASNDELFQVFTYKIDAAEAHRVEIAFANDGTSAGVNRDLMVDCIELGGKRLEAERDGYFEAKNNNVVFEGAREKLFVNGVLSFDEFFELA